MKHKHPEIETALRTLATSFSNGIVELPDLVTSLCAIADDAHDKHRRDPLRSPTMAEVCVLANLYAGDPPDAGGVSNARDTILACRDAGWLTLRGGTLSVQGIAALRRGAR